MSDNMQSGKTPFLARKLHGYTPPAGSNQSEALEASRTKASAVHVPDGALRKGSNMKRHGGALAHHEKHYKAMHGGALAHEDAPDRIPRHHEMAGDHEGARHEAAETAEDEAYEHGALPGGM